MFRRNADSIQGTGDTSIKSFFNFIQLNFYQTFDRGDITLYLINLTVGSIKLFNCNFFAFTFNMLTSLNQLFEVVAALASDLGVGTKTRQPNLAGIGFNVTQGSGLGVDFFFRITLDMVHLTRKRGRNGPQELRAWAQSRLEN